MPAILLAICIAVTTWLNAAAASDITAYQYFEDKTGAMTAQDVDAQNFTPANGNILNAGFSASTWWIKIKPEPHPEEDLYLTMIPANMAFTEAFQWTGSEWTKLELNNPAVAINTIFKKAHVTFKIDAINRSETILLKVSSRNTIFAVFTLENEKTLINKTIDTAIRLTIFLQLLIIFCGLLLVFGLYKRDLFMLAILLWSLQLGTSRILLGGAIPPGNFVSGTEAFLTLTAVGLPLSISLFLLALLHTHEIQGRLKIWATGIIAITASLGFFYFFNHDLISVEWATYWSIVPIVFLGVIPCTPSAFKRLGLPLSICIFLMAVVVFTLRTTQLAWMPEAFNEILSPSLHIPFFALLGIAALSKLKRTREQSESLQRQHLLMAQQEAENEKNRQLQQQKFMLMLTHELKNSLSVLRLFIQVAPAVPPYDRLAEQSVNDMDAIIERCGQLDLLERDEIQLNFKQVDLKELITQLVSQNSQRERIRFNYQTSAQVLHTDLILMRTMISNLIDNALKYSPLDSEITLHVRHTTDQHQTSEEIQGLIITVQNEVATMDIPDKNLIFTKYYRGTMANRVSGSGLGLYLVHSMSLLLGGELTYTNHDHYVTFKIWLPL